MAKFQLTISAEYVPTWGVAEGIREAVQNALDGAQAGYPMEVEPPTKGSPVLRIRNKGIVLERSIWLMGVTSKAGGDYRGCYGEGLKLGALALVRAGRTVAFANGDEDWRVKLEPSKTFSDCPVVTVYTVKRRQPVEDFTVSIDCTPEEWADSRSCFLDILGSSFKHYSTPQGRLLLDPAFAGRFYVKGIFVEQKEGMAYGYDFSRAQVDRDRRMINTFDVSWYSSAMWSHLITSEECPEINGPMVLDFLVANTEDARCFKSKYPSGAAQASVEAAWFARHGADTIPVSSAQEFHAAGHLGLKGIVSHASVSDFFVGSRLLDLNEVAKHRRAVPRRTYNLSELLPLELETLRVCVDLVNSAIASGAALGISSPLNHRMEIVDFPDPGTLGQHSMGEVPGRSIIRLARSVLSDFERTLEVLVHETAHDVAGDGAAAHQRAEGTLYCNIVLRALRGEHSHPPCFLP